MSTPTSTLDQRYSEPGASPTSWERTRRALEDAPLFWLTTVRADGRPHATPLVAVWLDGALHFATGAHEQKSRNLASNPRVLLTTGDGRWDGGLEIAVHGEAVRVTDDATLERLAEVWARKWDGRWEYEARGGAFRHGDGTAEALVHRVIPETVMAFGTGEFTHTVHRFAGDA